MLWPDMKGFFESHLKDLFGNLILPNIGVTRTSVELFEDEIELYIDYYFRGSEINTRRSAALDLLRVICRHYNHLFEPFLREQMESFGSIAGDTKAECNMHSLVIDGATKSFRDIDGCTGLHVSETLIQQTYQRIIKEKLGSIMEWMKNHKDQGIEK